MACEAWHTRVSSPRAWRGWGPETAFEVLARARALERAGREVIHLEIGEPDFDTPAHIVEAGDRGAARGRDALLPRGRACPSCARRSRASCRARAASTVAPERVLVANGAKPILFFTMLAACEPGRRGDLPRPRLPDLRVGDPLGRRDAGADAAARGARLPLRRRRARGAAQRPHEARHPQLAAQPDRRRARRRDLGRPPSSSAHARPGCSRTRSTRGSSTTASSPRSPACPGCSSGRSCSTASRRPTR